MKAHANRPFRKKNINKWFCTMVGTSAASTDPSHASGRVCARARSHYFSLNLIIDSDSIGISFEYKQKWSMAVMLISPRTRYVQVKRKAFMFT